MGGKTGIKGHVGPVLIDWSAHVTGFWRPQKKSLLKPPAGKG
jgi:hypothetical protein